MKALKLAWVGMVLCCGIYAQSGVAVSLVCRNVHANGRNLGHGQCPAGSKLFKFELKEGPVGQYQTTVFYQPELARAPRKFTQAIGKVQHQGRVHRFYSSVRVQADAPLYWAEVHESGTEELPKVVVVMGDFPVLCGDGKFRYPVYQVRCD